MALLTQVPACRIQDDNLIDPRRSHELCEADYPFAYCSPIVRLAIAFPIAHLAWDDSPESWQKHIICPF